MDHHEQLTPAPAPLHLRRFLVAEAPYRSPGDRRARLVPSRVAVLPWSVDRPWLSILVGRTFRFDPRAERRPLRLEPCEPAPFHAGSGAPERPRVDDFVPMRRLADVTLVGHVELIPLPSGIVPPRLAMFGLGDLAFPLVIQSPAPGRVPLRPPYTRTRAGRDFDLAPRAAHDGAAHGFAHALDFDLDAYQQAAPELRYDEPEDWILRLDGLLPGGEDEEIELPLPDLTPRALLDYAEAGVRPADVRLFLDSVAVDLDAGTVDVTFRGHAETAPAPRLDVDRVILGWAPRAAWESDLLRAWNGALRELPRGRFRWAVERDDALRGEAPPPLTEHELLMARYETWGYVEAAEPELAPEEAATLAAELAEQRWPSGELLGRRGLDEYAWSIEERAWAQRLSRFHEDPEDAEVAAYLAAYRRAQDALATPREAEITPAEYAVLAARIGRGDPMKALAAAGLGVGAWSRVERRMSALTRSDRALAEEIERLRAEEEARLEAEPLPGEEAEEEEAT